MCNVWARNPRMYGLPWGAPAAKVGGVNKGLTVYCLLLLRRGIRVRLRRECAWAMGRFTHIRDPHRFTPYYCKVTCAARAHKGYRG